MVNQLGKFIPILSDISKPLPDLLRKGIVWSWGEAQQIAFDKIKEILCSPEVLSHYIPRLPTIVAADGAKQGIGVVLLHVQESGERCPVCYASRALSDTEKRYAVIEKEALAVTLLSQKFSDYVLALQITVKSDHKPLVPLLSTTNLAKLPT